MSTTPTDLNNAATNNNNAPLSADETIVVQNQQQPSQYRVHAAATYTSLISGSIPPLNAIPPIEQDTMTIPIQNEQQMAASKLGWITPTKNVGGNNAVNIGNNAGEKITPPRGSICIMTPCSNSHPFEERRIQVTHSEENAIKIGRSVVRLQPSTNNAIFDCKVLSRNHAILWQNNEGQFLIKDTRSSNGTFINNERLSASGEESEPKELYSGDILQLGVEIVDNTKKVASGCVTCIIRLVNDRGEEFASRPQGDPFSQLQIRNEQQIPINYTLIRNDKIFVLEQYIKEAKFRENLLGQKLQTLEEQLIGAQEALQTRWEEHINQELLLSRIEFLESQLGFFTNNKKTPTSNTQQQMNEANDDEKDRLKKEMQELMEDRAKAEQIAKETIRTKLEEIQETSMRLQDAEMSLVNLEEECVFLRQKCSDYEEKKREEYETLLAKYNEVCVQLSALEKANISAPPVETNTAINGEIAIDQQSNENDGEAANMLNNHKNKAETTDEIETNSSTNSLNAEIKWIEVPTTQKELTPLENASNSEQQSNPIQHECQEGQLKQMVAETQMELSRQLESYNLLMEKYKQKEEQLEFMQTLKRVNNMVSAVDSNEIQDNATANVAAGHSSTDFQVFIISTLPFLLILMLICSPIFYFFGFPSTTIPHETDGISSAAHVENLVELDETSIEEETD